MNPNGADCYAPSYGADDDEYFLGPARLYTAGIYARSDGCADAGACRDGYIQRQ
jgi:hypothetical protein